MPYHCKDSGGRSYHGEATTLSGAKPMADCGGGRTLMAAMIGTVTTGDARGPLMKTGIPGTKISDPTVG